MLSPYNLLTDPLWPVKMAMAVFIGMLVFEWCMDTLNGPDDPDCPA